MMNRKNNPTSPLQLLILNHIRDPLLEKPSAKPQITESVIWDRWHTSKGLFLQPVRSGNGLASPYSVID